MEQCTRYEILDKYNVQDIKSFLSSQQIVYSNNYNIYQLLDIYFQNFKEIRKIYPFEQLNKFKALTVYKLCVDLKIIPDSNYTIYVNNFQKIEFMCKYETYIKNLTPEEVAELTATKYPESYIRIFTSDLKSANPEKVATLKISKDASILDSFFLANCIISNVRWIQKENNTFDVLEVLYCHVGTSVLDQILLHLNYDEFKEKLTVDDKLSLCTLHLYTDNKKLHLTNIQIDILKKLDLIRISKLFIGTYNGNIDLATLLYIFNTYKYPPVKYETLDVNIYLQLLQHPQMYVWNLNKFYETNHLISAYKNIASFKYNNIYFPIINSIVSNVNSLDIICNHFGIILPKGITNKMKYLQENLKHYYKIFIRTGKKIGLPPERNCEVNDLIWYTDVELFSFYDIDECKEFTNRIDLLERISTLSTIPVKWHFNFNKPCNENSHIIMMEPRVHEAKNPLISYGSLIRYKTYNLDEIDNSFKEYQLDGFRFKVPDGSDEVADYSLKDIVELLQLLKISDFQSDELNTFITKAEQGIMFLGNIHNRLHTFTKWISTDLTKSIQYGCILFVGALYMRKWAGPGNPYPYILSSKTTYKESEFRNSKALEIISSYYAFVESLEGEFKNRIINFPRIKYNFGTKDINIGYETIHDIMSLAAVANFCLSHFSDILIQTSYVLFIYILKLNIKQINDLLKVYLNSAQLEDFDFDKIAETGHHDPINKLAIIK